MFLTIMVAGLVGLIVMALPGIGRHGGHALHAGSVAKLPGLAQANATLALEHTDSVKRWTRIVPTPRLIFSVLALFGAFANVFLDAFGLDPWLSALAALVPAIAVERYAVSPLWRRLAGAQAVPSGRLEELILCEAEAVTAFRNGRGIVSVVREGRRVQLSATMIATQVEQPIRVGDRLRIEDLDARRERVTVSLLAE